MANMALGLYGQAAWAGSSGMHLPLDLSHTFAEHNPDATPIG